MGKKRSFRAICFLCCVILSGSFFHAQISPYKLKAHWPLDGNANETVNQTTGSVQGAIPCSNRRGQANKAYHFYGAEDSIYLPPANYVHPDSNFTLSFWFRSTLVSRSQPVNVNDSGFFQRNFNVVMNDLDSAMLTIWNSGGTYGIFSGATAQYSNNKWHNYLVTRKDTSISTYIDGEFHGSATNTLGINLNKGITLSGQYYHWEGDLDELVIYNRAFSQTDVDSLATNKYSNSILINSPRSQEAYPVNSTCTIEWQAPLSANLLKIQYSIDAGFSWIDTSDTLIASIGKYDWMMPDHPGKQCIIRLIDMNNNSVVGISQTFLISKYKWDVVDPSNSFDWRDGAGAYVFRDTMLLVGGWDPFDPDLYPNVTNSEVWASVDGDSWQLKTVAPFETRHTFGTLVYNNKMWVLGGDQIQDHFQPDVWSSSDGMNWQLVTANAPWGERVTHITCVFKNKMWVMGGQRTVGDNITNTCDTTFNDVWNSSDGINWTKVTDHAGWCPRAQIQGSCVFKNKMWVLGGGTYNDGRKYFKDIWSSEDGINWTLVSNEAPWPRRQYHNMVVYDNKMWVLAGWDGISNMNDVWYSEDGINWIEQKNTPWEKRHAGSVFNYHNSLYMVAGNMWSDSWRMNTLICDTILSQPFSQTVTTAGTASFSVVYSGTGADYQWQNRVDGIWNDLIESGRFVGVNESLLKLVGNGQSVHEEDFRCIVLGGVCTYTSDPVNLKVFEDVGIKENSSTASIGIYPNPANNIVAISFDEVSAQADHHVYVRDLSSRQIAELKLQGGHKEYHLNVSEFANGVYFMTVEGKDGVSKTCKLIIAH